MALVNLKTDLTSLKFGKDRPGGGSSNQPYIEKPLNLDLPPAFDFLGNDFLLRGGPVGAPLATVNDVARLTKYFTDFKNPSGLLFAAKQNLLSRTAVKTQTSGDLNEGIYTPLSTLAQVGVSAFGLHVNKQGLNPFEETGAYATNNENLYAVKIQEEKLDFINGAPDYIAQNRLYGLYITKMVNADNPSSPFYTKNSISSNPNNLLTYNGGPGSDLGIGNTNIRFADQRTGINNFNAPIGIYTISSPNPGTALVETDYSFFKKSEDLKIAINGNKLLGLSNQYLNLSSSINTGFDENGSIDPFIRSIGQLDLPDSVLFPYINPRSLGSYTYSQNDLENTPTEDDGDNESFYIGNGQNGQVTTPGDFRQKLRNTDTQKATKAIGNLTNAPNYISQNIETRVNLGDPGNRNGKNLTSYVEGAFNEGSLFGAASYNSYDKINVYPLYQSENVISDSSINDLVKFRIGVINNNNPSQKTYIHFRAFLDQISDQYTSDLDSTQYIGRGEKFYTYKGFDRKVSLSWTVAAQSKAELIPMYKKLNYLASVCAPDYSGNGYMRGNIITLTIGGYFYEQPGLITGFSYEMNEDNATWEIGIDDNTAGTDSSVKELPHLIKVTGFNFIPIHTFVPRKVQGTGNFNVKEKYISLQAVTNNYDPINSPDFRRQTSIVPPSISDDNLGEDIPNI